MLLSDDGIHAALFSGELVIDPPPSARLIQPASVDVRLGSAFRLFRHQPGAFIDPDTSEPGLTELTTLSGHEVFVLEPGDFALGCTLETVTLSPAIAARLEGKSSLGRLGLVVHSTAGWIDPGFSGQITLELSNLSPLPVILRPGRPIGQLCVMRLSSPASRPYGSPELGSKYQGQCGPTPSRVGP